MKFIQPLLLVFVFVTAAVCDERTVDFDQQTDFSHFKTFSIRQGRITAKGPELNSSLVKDKIEAAIRTQLSNRKMEEVSGQPDLIVNYSLGAVNKKELRTWTGPRGRVWRNGVDHFAEGTIVVDMRDRADRDLVWRGIYRDDEKDAGKISKKLDDDIKKLFDKYPVKK